MTADNDRKRLVEAVFAATARGDGRPFTDALADDCTWTVMGTTSWSRTYAGKAAITGELLARLRSAIAGRIVTVPERVIAEGDVVVVEARGENTTRAGAPYRNRYCFVIQVAGGKLVDIREYCDTALVERTLP